MALLRTLTLLLALTWVLAPPSEARQLQFEQTHDLAVRLDGAGLSECWTALFELRSCTNEIILFFLNGEAYLGLDCCKAIRIVTRQCWPAMLASLGFTAEEADILRGYCGASDTPMQSPPLGPASDFPLASMELGG